MSLLTVRRVMAGIALGAVVVVPQAMASGTTDIRLGTPGPRAAAPAGVFYQEWLYPGPAGSTTCSAKAEYHDGRVKQGALKPEYYGINAKGDAFRMDASRRDYACNGYSTANANDVKAWSAQQYVTVSLADLASERRLTSSRTKRAAAVDTLSTFAKNIGFTGVDVDFENYWDWSATDHANFMTFVRELAAGLHAKGLRLQVEGPPDIDTAFHYGDVLAAGADEVVMMAYDLQYQSPVGDTCIAFAPYQWATDLIEGALAEIPQDQRHRFVAGLPSEAYTATGRCQNIVGNLTYADMRKAPGFSTDPKVIESRRDPESGEIRWRVGDTFYDYVDQQALDSKLALVRGLGVNNVSVWVLGGGNHWFSDTAGVATHQGPPRARVS
ncbi:glycosyl hydrolase family 18 protein [Streptomyces sp. NPDC094032]|uniref:glycosyl hydrolase family 18 protein n=1 Tax=Streptomyces sp. NPDC094032 TaxID=3155308 RepID=UPI0033269C20